MKTYMAIGVDHFGAVWEYRFLTMTEAVEFIEAVGGDTHELTWHVREVTDSVWSVDEAADHFNATV